MSSEPVGYVGNFQLKDLLEKNTSAIKLAVKGYFNAHHATPLYTAEALSAEYRRGLEEAAGRKFNIGDRVTKIKGSSWTGRVCGFYSTSLTPAGYAVESETEKGSVQIYPEAALCALADKPKEDA